MANSITATQLNKMLEAVHKEFDFDVGKYSRTRQQYSRIMRPSGYKNAGRIMSYKEAKERMQKAVSPDIKVSFSYKEYKKDIEKFYEEQKIHLNVETEREFQREKAEEVVRDAFEYMGEEVPDLSKYTYEQLRDIIREANVQYSNKYKDDTNSFKFYERVVNEFKNIKGNGDAEAQ